MRIEKRVWTTYTCWSPGHSTFWVGREGEEFFSRGNPGVTSERAGSTVWLYRLCREERWYIGRPNRKPTVIINSETRTSFRDTFPSISLFPLSVSTLGDLGIVDPRLSPWRLPWIQMSLYLSFYPHSPPSPQGLQFPILKVPPSYKLTQVTTSFVNLSPVLSDTQTVDPPVVLEPIWSK